MLPVVSVICCAYNHGPYIRQCLDGFMMQKTDFSFEVLIHDDASTDNTAEIIREYELKYPDTIFPIYATQNKYSKGIDIFSEILVPNARGKYIAICEGDDYWTDPLKLQKQVVFLEDNADYVLSTHCYIRYLQSSEMLENVIMPLTLNEGITYTLEDYISYTNWYTQPLTALFRRQVLGSFGDYTSQKDASLFYGILKSGKGYLCPEVMGVYRIQDGGVWSSASRQNRIIADLYTLKGIYDAEKTKTAALYLYNFLYKTRYLGVKFYINKTPLYLDVLLILLKEFKTSALKVFLRNINFLSR